MEIDRRKTALLVVDMLVDFVYPQGKVYYPQNKEILPKVLCVLEIMRSNGNLILFAQHYHRKDLFDRELHENRRLNCMEGSGGEELIAELNYNPDREYIVKKRRYNAFAGTDLDMILREHDIRNLIIIGTKTNCCIRATVEGAYHLEYLPIVIRECVATNSEEVNNVHLTDISKYLGEVWTMQQFEKWMDDGKIQD